MELGNQGAFARLASVPDGGQPCHLRRQQYSIRKAKGQDSPGILACLREAFEEFRERYTPGGVLETVLTPNTLRERLEAISVVVRSIPGSKLSARSPRAWSVWRKGIFGGMAVLPSMRGTGIAAGTTQAGGSRAGAVQVRARYAGYYRAAPAGGALLRKTRLPAFRKNQGLLRDALDRLAKNFAVKRRRSSSGIGSKEFLLLGGF